MKITATASGIQHLTGFWWLVCWFVALLVGWIPLAGTGLGIYGAYADWGWSLSSSILLFVGVPGGLKTNNPADQEKAIVYNELVANAVAAQTVNDLTHALNKLHDRGINIAAEDLAHFSPYPTSKVKRFGDYPAQVITDSRPIQKHLPVSSVSMAAL